MEVWKNVVGYEGIYEVSSLGKVRTHAKNTGYLDRRSTKSRKQRIIKPQKSLAANQKCLRANVELYKEGSRKRVRVHRLVAEAFIPNPEKLPQVNHKDGNPLNNHVENLEWCTHKENVNHGFDNGLFSQSKPIILTNEKTCEEHFFRSQTKASHFLGKRDKFISEKLQQGVDKVDGYRITRYGGRS
ncbi:NUMOD4 motif [Oceanobacillus oncorhynchi]|uniref:NUMOD4 motif n=1 Tax=Oceanobacillus oncorhynchi TaxID=545501 RepID=A0A0A1MNQ8_9BACI|nr:NUMOD4 motif-containing HNH endonuclease [Oceanobacillus oncorhynchi]CEI81277.1 NUMOD4 motif [Oceanobacillus oncorhynchi]